MVVARTFTSPPPSASDRRRPHLLALRGDPRLLSDQNAVGVDEPPAALLDLAVGLTQEIEVGGTVVARVVGGKQRSDVSSRQRRAPRRPAHARARRRPSGRRGRGRSRSEHRRARAARPARVRAPVDTDPVATSCQGARQLVERGDRIAPAGGSWRWPHGPRRMCTPTIPAAIAGPTSLSARLPDVRDHPSLDRLG